MTKKFSLEKHFISVIIMAVILVVLDFFTPGLDLFSFRLGRMATASLIVDYGQGRTRQFVGEVTKKMTVFDAFTASSRGGLRVDYAHNGHGLIFFSVDGRTGDLKIKVNNRLVQIEKLNEIMLTKGDLIKIDLP